MPGKRRLFSNLNSATRFGLALLDDFCELKLITDQPIDYAEIACGNLPSANLGTLLECHSDGITRSMERPC